MARRIRDLTPTPNTGSQWKPPLGAGQGPRLLEAIASEIMPFVEANYAAATTGRTVIGWSLGGLFALTALFHRPDLFQRYLVIGPSLWWDRRSIFADEAAWAGSHPDLPARLFMAVGSEEEKAGGGWLSEGFSDETISLVPAGLELPLLRPPAEGAEISGPAARQRWSSRTSTT